MFARAFQAAAIGTGASSLPAIAGLWREGQDGQPAFTMLTTEPGPDVSPYHNRQVVVLRPDAWAAWIYLTRPEAELLRRCRRIPEGGNRASGQRLSAARVRRIL